MLGDGRTLEVIVDTCHADLDLHVDVDESTEEVRISIERNDHPFFGAGDDCQDSVGVALDTPVGSRRAVTGDDRELPIRTTSD